MIQVKQANMGSYQYDEGRGLIFGFDSSSSVLLINKSNYVVFKATVDDSYSSYTEVMYENFYYPRITSLKRAYSFHSFGGKLSLLEKRNKKILIKIQDPKVEEYQIQDIINNLGLAVLTNVDSMISEVEDFTDVRDEV